MKTTYDLIREMQEASMQKYDSYSHAAGALGVLLDSAVFQLPKREQKYFNERLLETIAWLRQE